MIKNILVPVDGSKNSERALELACDLGSKYEANLTILHVIPNPVGTQAMVVGSAAVVVEPDLSHQEDQGKRINQAAFEKAVAVGQRPDEVVTVYGSIATEIVKYAKENKTDMIVMGSRGLSDFAGFFMGSVSHKVSHLSECSCVTVH
jgi:nucleotide-binding universal stress UspA family protein